MSTPKGLKDYELKAYAFQWFLLGAFAGWLVMMIIGYGGDIPLD